MLYRSAPFAFMARCTVDLKTSSKKTVVSERREGIRVVRTCHASKLVSEANSGAFSINADVSGSN